MTRTITDKTALKREIWAERTGRIMGTSAPDTIALLSQPRQQSLRLNPLVAAPHDTLAALHALGWIGTSYPWAQHCYTIDAGLVELIRDSELASSGALYIQNAASWLPVLALDPQSGDAILDVCAAPGGKASHVAAITNNQADLTVNDNSRIRLARMRANLNRLGVTAEYTLYDASRLARKLEGQQFDKILLDAPCGGEGLMEYTRDKDFQTWSVAHIKRLNSLQKQIIMQAWQLLSPGGTLVYSTCTMAPEENEAVVDYLLRKRTDAEIIPFTADVANKIPALRSWNDKTFAADLNGCLRLAPSPRIEAFFVCRLHKLAESSEIDYSRL